MRRHLRLNRHRFLDRQLWRTSIIFWFGAMLVGAVATSFAMLADIADNLFQQLYASNSYLPFLVTPTGLLLIVYATRRLFPGAEGSGVPQVFIALETDQPSLVARIMSWNAIIGRYIMVLLGLLCGASVGRIGPSIHIGAAIMYNLGQFVNKPGKYFERGLMIAGGGAGLAAGFNAPIAGIMFAFEEMARWFDRRQISLVMISVILAGMTAILMHYGNYNYRNLLIPVDDQGLWLAVIACGLIGGLAGGVFSQILILASRWLSPYRNRHWVLITLCCGVILSIAGFLSDGAAFGSGYQETTVLVTCSGNQVCDVELGPMYPVYKFITTAAAFLAGIPAGIFVPVLATGAGLGNDIAMLFPSVFASTIIILGMIAYFSAVMQTPVTAFIVAMEMTGNHDLVLAMMATSLVAAGVARLICKVPIYQALAENILQSLRRQDEAVKES